MIKGKLVNITIVITKVFLCNEEEDNVCFTTAYNIVSIVLPRLMEQENKKVSYLESIKLSVDKLMLSIENSKESTRKLLELINSAKL